MKKKIKKLSIKERILNSPLQYLSIKRMKRKYEEMGRPFQIQKLVTSFIVAIGITSLYSHLFCLEIPYAIMCFIAAIIFTPYFLITDEQCRYEEGRFDDINSYMQQLVHEMILYRKITTSLEKMLSVFTSGQMHDTIKEALYHITTRDDFRVAESEALRMIEDTYSNPQLETIHDFCMRIEERGGDFEYEMKILDDIRDKWMKRIQKYQKKLFTVLIFSIFEFFAMALVCRFVLTNMPDQMDVTYNPLTQLINVAMLISFMFIICMIQKKRRKGWLIADSLVDEKEANELIGFVEKYEKKLLDNKHGVKMAVIVVWVTAILVFISKNTAFLVVGALIAGVLININRIIYYISRFRIKEELTKAFPSWLFDICLLIQKDSIPIAITKSILDAPPIMLHYVLKLDEEIKKNPASEQPLVSFLEAFNIQGVKNTMRMLVSLLRGNTSDQNLQMKQMISHNLALIDDRNEEQDELNNAVIQRYYFYPIIPGCATLIVYLFNTIIKIFTSLSMDIGF